MYKDDLYWIWQKLKVPPSVGALAQTIDALHSSAPQREFFGRFWWWKMYLGLAGHIPASWSQSTHGQSHWTPPTIHEPSWSITQATHEPLSMIADFNEWPYCFLGYDCGFKWRIASFNEWGYIYSILTMMMSFMNTCTFYFWHDGELLRMIIPF